MSSIKYLLPGGNDRKEDFLWFLFATGACDPDSDPD